MKRTTCLTRASNQLSLFGKVVPSKHTVVAGISNEKSKRNRDTRWRIQCAEAIPRRLVIPTSHHYTIVHGIGRRQGELQDTIGRSIRYIKMCVRRIQCNAHGLKHQNYRVGRPAGQCSCRVRSHSTHQHTGRGGNVRHSSHVVRAGTGRNPRTNRTAMRASHLHQLPKLPHDQQAPLSTEADNVPLFERIGAPRRKLEHRGVIVCSEAHKHQRQSQPLSC
mmetsp:Transcript_41602/g.109583  ORF Transcript_41602/g.109583 Transcript_41602/m.109583 type:complete len:220 (-) Transcript_41602:114-773(-)